MLRKYRKSELLKYLGVSRDTLRFYEEKGLISPQKDNDNNYRSYDFFDIFRIMIIDFYKARGMTIQQIQDLLVKSDIQDMQNIMETKKKELIKIIYDYQCMIERIDETLIFANELDCNLNTFTIRSFPKFRIKGEVSEFIALEEYENILELMNSTNNDMLSQLMRYITFNKNGITGTKMIIVETVNEQKEKDISIEYPNCLYTVIVELQPNEKEDTIEKMFRLSTDYADEHGLMLLGEAFANIRLITYRENETKAYIEIFVPFE